VNYLVRLNNDGPTDNDVQVANASIAGSAGAGSCSDGSLRQAVCQLVDPLRWNKPGATTSAAFFAAAGNSGRSAGSYAPGRYPEAIAVSAYDCSSITCFPTKPRLASFSNRGAAIDIGAPGVGIVSSRRGGGRETASGTSRAAPMAAGAAADLLSASPGLSPSALRDALLKGGKCPDLAQNGTTGNCTSRGSWTNDTDGFAEPFLNVNGAITGSGPSASFVAPTNGATVRDNVSIQVRATGTINSVTVRVDGTQLGLGGTTFDGANYNTPWNTFTHADGPATIEAIVSATNGTTTISEVVHVDNEDSDPTVSFVSPSSGATVAPTFTVTVSARDDHDTPTATLAVDGGSATAMSCTSGLTVTCTRSLTLAAGSHSLTAQSFDAHSHSSAPLTISVTVSSAPPPPTWTRVTQNGTGWTSVGQTGSGVFYTGGWSNGSASCTSGGTYKYSKVDGATADFEFSGNSVRFVTALGPNLGRAELWLEGETTHVFIDTYQPNTTSCQVKFERTGLGAGPHRLHVRVSGTKNPSATDKNIIVDGFQSHP
jgi:hypothetical protein